MIKSSKSESLLFNGYFVTFRAVSVSPGNSCFGEPEMYFFLSRCQFLFVGSKLAFITGLFLPINPGRISNTNFFYQLTEKKYQLNRKFQILQKLQYFEIFSQSSNKITLFFPNLKPTHPPIFPQFYRYRYLPKR